MSPRVIAIGKCSVVPLLFLSWRASARKRNVPLLVANPLVGKVVRKIRSDTKRHMRKMNHDHIASNVNA